MAKEKEDLKKRIESYKYDFGLLQKISCTKEQNKKYKELIKNGNKLPDGVFPYVDTTGKEFDDSFYTVYEPELSKEEIDEYLALKKLSLLNTIKNCSVFFVALTIISLFITVFFFLGNIR